MNAPSSDALGYVGAHPGFSLMKLCLGCEVHPCSEPSATIHIFPLHELKLHLGWSPCATWAATPLLPLIL